MPWPGQEAREPEHYCPDAPECALMYLIFGGDMKTRKSGSLCFVCNPDTAEPGQYCETHSEELHRLDHQYETLFRLQRTSRGKDHEGFHLYFMPGDCEPAGRIIVTETDPDNLLVNVMLTSDLDLDSRIADYEKLGIERTYGDQLRERIKMEIVHSWYGTARACVDIFRTTNPQAQHLDIEPRGEEGDDSGPHPPDQGKHSVH
jgi:hypothetical protein